MYIYIYVKSHDGNAPQLTDGTVLWNEAQFSRHRHPHLCKLEEHLHSRPAARQLPETH